MIAAAVALMRGRWISEELAVPLLYGSVLMFIRAMQSIQYAFLRVEERTKEYNVIEVYIKAAATILIVALLLTWETSIRAFLIASCRAGLPDFPITESAQRLVQIRARKRARELQEARTIFPNEVKPNDLRHVDDEDDFADAVLPALVAPDLEIAPRLRSNPTLGHPGGPTQPIPIRRPDQDPSVIAHAGTVEIPPDCL